MGSLISGFENDIFISYRQKDNKGDRWVSEFVNALRGELESTFKEDVTVYFDINPHDGLLETHNVDASLKEKLKCLILIPVISQTYCDSECFAWQHELVAFNKMAKEDRFGRDIRLASGNIASRILPVKIHDLDQEDRIFHENELGRDLRSVDFIYRTPGVNRPLRANEDHPNDNLNKIYYRDQINKVANAVKEIIVAMKKLDNDGSCTVVPPTLKIRSIRSNKSKFLILPGVILFLICAFFFFNEYTSSGNHKNRFIREESVIKVESENNTTDSARIINPAMIEYLLKFNLSYKCKSTYLDPEQFDKIYPVKRKEINLPMKTIDFRINNGEFLHEYEVFYKITDNRDHTSTESEIVFHDRTDLLNLTGNLVKIAAALGATNPGGNFLTNDWSAFENFYTGELSWDVLDKNKAKKYFRNSIKIDSTFILPYLRLAKVYVFEEDYKSAKEFINTVKESKGKLTIPDSISAMALWYTLNGLRKETISSYKALVDYLPAQKESYFELAEAYYFIRDIKDASLNYRKALTIDPNFALAHNHYAYCLSHSGQHDSALIHVRKYLALNPTANAYDSFGDILFASGNLDSAKAAKKMGLKLDPNLDYIYTSLAYINVQQGKFKEAEQNINTYISMQKEPGRISLGLTNKAFIYFAEDELKKSLDTCLKAISIFDSKDLLIRNHVLHWLMCRIYLENNDKVSLASEMNEINSIIRKNNINEFNYNMIFKFYLDIRIQLLFKDGKYDEAKELIDLFDNEIYDKVKDWSYPFDIAFFNTEFGYLYLEAGMLDPAKQRFDKALGYNPKYPLAHLGLAVYYGKMNDEPAEKKQFNLFSNAVKNADPESRIMAIEAYARLINKNN